MAAKNSKATAKAKTEETPVDEIPPWESGAVPEDEADLEEDDRNEGLDEDLELSDDEEEDFSDDVVTHVTTPKNSLIASEVGTSLPPGQPDPTTKAPPPSAEPNPPAVQMSTEAMQAYLRDLVAPQVAGLVAEGVKAELARQAEAAKPKIPDVPKITYKKHYRNETTPNVKIQLLDMGSAVPQDNPIPGRWIEFRLGHLHTNDDNVIAQVEQMIQRPSTDEEGRVISSGAGIYEDDGSVLFQCPHDGFVTASAASYRAHMKATHGVEIPVHG